MAQTHRVTGTATSIRTDADGTHIRYHKTDVVSFTADTVTLRSGGWETVTTKRRMNQAATQFGLGFRVIQRNGAWLVWNGLAYYAFVDGMTLPRDALGRGELEVAA